jgi:hypothetical protein
MKHIKILTDFWFANYLDTESQLCCLCGNTGKIHLKGVKSPAGAILNTKEVYCLCPNGILMKEGETK